MTITSLNYTYFQQSRKKWEGLHWKTSEEAGKGERGNPKLRRHNVMTENVKEK